MDYCLDAGDGTATMWSGPADVDLDGDGRFDDLMIDDDGDGLADHAALDLNDDAVPETRVIDDGSGTWYSGTAGGAGPLRWFGLDGVEHTGTADLDGNGTPDRLIDSDRDGLADRAVVTDGRSATGYVDTDGDGKWDVTLRDADGDGSAESAGPV